MSTDTTLITKCSLRSKRTLAYPALEVRVVSGWGAGRLVYATDDGWFAVQLDGESRIDEYPAQYWRRVD